MRDSWGSTHSSSWAMPIVQLTVLICLMAVSVSGCSRSEPAPRDFILADQRRAQVKNPGKAPEEVKDPATALEEAKNACKEETRRKGIASIFGIMSRLREGSADEDYVACMKARGYQVEP